MMSFNEPPTRTDLWRKASLLVNGVDFDEGGLLPELEADNKTRPGTGLYNYHRTDEDLPEEEDEGLEVSGQQDIRAPNEMLFPDNPYPLRVEIRSNPESPYKVKSEGGGYALHDEREGGRVARVSFPEQHPFNFEESQYGTLYGNIVHQMGENALRVYPDMTCLMDKPGIKCRFCGTLPERRKNKLTGETLTDEEIISEISEAIEAAQRDMDVDHVFMSTGAFYDMETTRFYGDLIEEYRRVLDNDAAEILFALTPPPEMKTEQLDVLLDAGVSDLSFNLEAWDDSLWDLSNDHHLGEFKVGRGKKDHFEGFDRTVSRLGPGSAKSNFVGGIESHETLFEGFEALLDQGVVPSITVFYETPGSVWAEQEGFNPTHSSFQEDPEGYLVDAYLGLASRTIDAGLRPHWAKQNRISGLEWDAYLYQQETANIQSRVEAEQKVI